MPYPPSVNTYWRNVKGKTLISEKGRKYRETVKRELGGLFPGPMTGRISIMINACMPDNRARDLDNLSKATFDSLTHAGAWLDDSQIDFFSFARGAVSPGNGYLDVSIEEID